jgi:hypothetical protein
MRISGVDLQVKPRRTLFPEMCYETPEGGFRLRTPSDWSHWLVSTTRHPTMLTRRVTSRTLCIS